MLKTIEAVYDGKAFLPEEPIELAANTRVHLIVKTFLPAELEMRSFLEVASQLDLDGPSDWSVRLDEYLYGDRDADGQ